MRRLIHQVDEIAAIRYAQKSERRKYNGHDRPSAYQDGFLAGVRYARRKNLTTKSAKE